ncbi:NADP(H)-dependent aldo-keto reductase [Reinekea marinisedimentorum]|uniref:Protein tas n=1 Tax=Reinekea marinisedimentorum TaxID=230495 RepID=A0A4R3I857_9GAMM|nr:NADP(H)-dependent aldo-keto reductase [Reinekea marinisedimentorum]TCS42433.1 aryl-alcohol dehydrogenase-like predicted oxidoreductase [Reinekea marinisedimentorum]
MEYRQLGRTNLKVSKLCLGTMTFGEQNTEAEAHEQMDYALANGINFFDAAEMYPVPPKPETQGLTEQYIGSWFAKTGNRDKVVMATKVASSGMNHIRPNADLRADEIVGAVEKSLKRLQTDYIDLYQIHWPSRPTNFFGKLGYVYPDGDNGVAIDETLEACTRLVQSGKVRHIGVSNETPWGVAEYLRLSREQDLARVASIQNPYNLLNRTFEIGLAEFARQEQVGLLAYSPLGMGLLTGKYRHGARPANARLTLFTRFQRYMTDLAAEVTEQYLQLAEQHELNPAQMALAFVSDRPFVSSNIFGATTMEQLKLNIASAELKLSDEVLQGIEAIHMAQPNPCP